jgi:hypothetical protein
VSGRKRLVDPSLCAPHAENKRRLEEKVNDGFNTIKTQSRLQASRRCTTYQSCKGYSQTCRTTCRVNSERRSRNHKVLSQAELAGFVLRRDIVVNPPSCVTRTALGVSYVGLSRNVLLNGSLAILNGIFPRSTDGHCSVFPILGARRYRQGLSSMTLVLRQRHSTRGVTVHRVTFHSYQQVLVSCCVTDTTVRCLKKSEARLDVCDGCPNRAARPPATVP